MEPDTLPKIGKKWYENNEPDKNDIHYMFSIYEDYIKNDRPFNFDKRNLDDLLYTIEIGSEWTLGKMTMIYKKAMSIPKRINNSNSEIIDFQLNENNFLKNNNDNMIGLLGESIFYIENLLNSGEEIKEGKVEIDTFEPVNKKKVRELLLKYTALSFQEKFKTKKPKKQEVTYLKLNDDVIKLFKNEEGGVIRLQRKKEEPEENRQFLYDFEDDLRVFKTELLKIEKSAKALMDENNKKYNKEKERITKESRNEKERKLYLKQLDIEKEKFESNVEKSIEAIEKAVQRERKNEEKLKKKADDMSNAENKKNKELAMDTAKVIISSISGVSSNQASGWISRAINILKYLSVPLKFGMMASKISFYVLMLFFLKTNIVQTFSERSLTSLIFQMLSEIGGVYFLFSGIGGFFSYFSKKEDENERYNEILNKVRGMLTTSTKEISDNLSELYRQKFIKESEKGIELNKKIIENLVTYVKESSDLVDTLNTLGDLVVNIDLNLRKTIEKLPKIKITKEKKPPLILNYEIFEKYRDFLYIPFFMYSSDLLDEKVKYHDIFIGELLDKKKDDVVIDLMFERYDVSSMIIPRTTINNSSIKFERSLVGIEILLVNLVTNICDIYDLLKDVDKTENDIDFLITVENFKDPESIGYGSIRNSPNKDEQRIYIRTKINSIISILQAIFILLESEPPELPKFNIDYNIDENYIDFTFKKFGLIFGEDNYISLRSKCKEILKDPKVEDYNTFSSFIEKVLYVFHNNYYDLYRRITGFYSNLSNYMYYINIAYFRGFPEIFGMIKRRVVVVEEESSSTEEESMREYEDELLSD